MGRIIEEIRKELGDEYEPNREDIIHLLRRGGLRGEAEPSGQEDVASHGHRAPRRVLQTALEAARLGYRPVVILNATSSRREEEYKMVIKRLMVRGVDVASTETVIFELLKDASRPEFKQVLGLIKGV